jgi:hypothetical protein
MTRTVPRGANAPPHPPAPASLRQKSAFLLGDRIWIITQQWCGTRFICRVVVYSTKYKNVISSSGREGIENVSQFSWPHGVWSCGRGFFTRKVWTWLSLWRVDMVPRERCYAMQPRIFWALPLCQGARGLKDFFCDYLYHPTHPRNGQCRTRRDCFRLAMTHILCQQLTFWTPSVHAT